MSKEIKGEQFNYKMLTIARESRGLTQAELAEKSETDASNLSRFEQGKVMPTVEILCKYAKVLKYPISFFYKDPPLNAISDFFYRKRTSLPAKQKSKLEAQVEIIRMVYDSLLKSVSIPDVNLPSVTISKNFTTADAAILTKEFWGIKRAAVLNLVSKVEKAGIAVIYIDTDSDKFDGMTVYSGKNNPIIVLNKNMPNDRKRFTICHELGHQIAHLPYRYDFELYERLNTDPNIFEKEADSFAAEFLLPANECKNELTDLTYGKLSQLKSYWQVSKKALIYRAKTLGCIDEIKYKNLLVELSRSGERVNETVDVEMDKPKLFNQILKAHYDNLNYNEKELAEILSIDKSDLDIISQINDYTKLRIAV